jgi:hypothetical protein
MNKNMIIITELQQQPLTQTQEAESNVKIKQHDIDLIKFILRFFVFVKKYLIL